MKHGTWTVTFGDKRIVKRSDGFNISNAPGVVVDDDDFWNQSKFNGIRAIQYTGDASDTDQVETETGNVAYDASALGSFQQFVDKFDVAYTASRQADWDNDTVSGETEEQKVARLGARPGTYTSTPI